jgi:DNA-binding MarR family transcriptional regulator
VVNVNVANDIDARVLAERLRPVLFKLTRELRRELHRLNVTVGQVALLVAIHKRPGIGVRELAAQERISPAAMSGYVERLTRAGLVERTPDAFDRRRHGLSVTAAGEKLLRSVRSRRTAWLAARLALLAPGDRAAIDEAVEPLAKLLEDVE